VDPAKQSNAKQQPSNLPFHYTRHISLQAISAQARDLLSRLISVDPAKRLSATEALNHPYFKAAPPPTPLGKLPIG
jgi:serine/threonine protein kinase